MTLGRSPSILKYEDITLYRNVGIGAVALCQIPEEGNLKNTASKKAYSSHF